MALKLVMCLFCKSRMRQLAYPCLCGCHEGCNCEWLDFCVGFPPWWSRNRFHGDFSLRMREFAVAWAPTEGRTQQCETAADVAKKCSGSYWEQGSAWWNHYGAVLDFEHDWTWVAMQRLGAAHMQLANSQPFLKHYLKLIGKYKKGRKLQLLC
jgi:hypothetical protein